MYFLGITFFNPKWFLSAFQKLKKKLNVRYSVFRNTLYWQTRIRSSIKLKRKKKT